MLCKNAITNQLLMRLPMSYFKISMALPNTRFVFNPKNHIGEEQFWQTVFNNVHYYDYYNLLNSAKFSLKIFPHTRYDNA